MVGVVIQGNLTKNQAIQQLQLVMIQLCVVGSVDHPRLSRHAALPASSSRTVGGLWCTGWGS